MAQINKPSDYFTPITYTGTSSTQSITTGFQPDWVWIKGRSFADAHYIYDSIRGATNAIFSHSTAAESSNANSLTSFNSDGFTVGSEGGVNGSGQTLVSWNWLGGGTASSNTDGSITSQVSANTTSGFSIVSWTGNGTASTIGHGLGVTPKMIILKNRSVVEGWLVYHHKNDATAPQNKYLFLNQTNAVADLDVWNDTAPTSSVFSVGGYNGSNGSGNNMIAYCFAEKKGFSKFGSYVGNGSTDGTFVYTGMRPAFFMLKRTDSTSQWVLYDNKRQNNYNPQDERAYPNLSDAPGTGRDIDFLSNGIKLRDNATDSSAYNVSGANYIYMAFAENPLVGTNNIPATAR